MLCNRRKQPRTAGIKGGEPVKQKPIDRLAEAIKKAHKGKQLAELVQKFQKEGR